MFGSKDLSGLYFANSLTTCRVSCKKWWQTNVATQNTNCGTYFCQIWVESVCCELLVW